MYSVDGDILETILIHKNMCEDGHAWILGLGLFKVIGLRDSQMQASTVVLTNEFGTSILYLPSVTTVKIEPNDDNVLVLLDSCDDVCHVVDFSDTSPFPCRIRTFTLVLDFVDID